MGDVEETVHIAASDRQARPSSRLGWAAVAFLALAGVAFHSVTPSTLLREVSYLVVGSGAALAAWLGARRPGRPARVRLIALGVALSAMADLVYQVTAWVQRQPPDLSLADIAWLASYVAIAASLLLALRATSVRRIDLHGWIDIAVVTVVALLVQWELGLAEVAQDATVALTVRFVWLLYPAFDAVLLALLVRTGFAHRLHSRAGLLLALGTMAWLISDVLFTILTPAVNTTLWLDAGWLGGAMLLAAAAWQTAPGPTATPAVAHETRVRVGYGRVLLGLAPLALPGIIEVVGHAAGRDPEPVPLLLATLALIALAFLRIGLVMRSDADAHLQLRRQERYSSAVAANSSDAVVILDADGMIGNDAYRLAALLGLGRTTLQDVDVLSYTEPEDRSAGRAVIHRALRSPGQVLETQVRVRHVDSHFVWLGVRLVNLLDDPDVEGIVVTLHDITARKAAEEGLVHQAFHDGLTGLANRALFSDRVEQALLAVTSHRPAVIVLDLDGFKTINDSLGHSAGDDLLREVAHRLNRAVGPGETVARLGGDEFAVLVPAGSQADRARATAESILLALRTPYLLGERTVRMSASLGIAVADRDVTAAAMLQHAEVAMYEAKSSGRGRWVVFSEEMGTAALDRLRLETDLVAALEQHQLAVVYQPIVELRGTKVIGFEALLRWHHPSLGTVMPDRFIPLAEETGLIVPIGAWVLDEACRTAARWQRAHPDQADLSMAVNVSARQIASPELVSDVQSALARSGLDPAHLVLEVTESALVSDPSVAASRLRVLRGLGIRLALDDFGTGYSSLSYLRQFPADILKIDRSFVASITEPDQSPALVRGLLGLARTLGLETIAEGVELEVQRNLLRAEGCDHAQGYLFAPPLDAADAELLLASASVTRGAAPA